jgi:lipid A 3-O-deacylase
MMKLINGGRQPIRRIFMTVALFAGLILAAAQARSQAAMEASSSQSPGPPLSSKWAVETFFTGGFVPEYWVRNGASSRRVELNFYTAGFSAARALGSPHRIGELRERTAAEFELEPFWLAHYPRQTQKACYAGQCDDTRWGPYRVYGVSVTPALVRWNLLRNADSRIAPWAQAGVGFLWTNRSFPALAGNPGVINFTPQAGAGTNIFVKKNQSFDFGFKVMHISNAGLGDTDPGINVSLRFTVGYRWWL